MGKSLSARGIQWNLLIKKTLGPDILSTFKRFSTLHRYIIYFRKVDFGMIKVSFVGKYIISTMSSFPRILEERFPCIVVYKSHTDQMVLNMFK